MNVLSLFDGISAGKLALHRAGVGVDTYHASEISENAIAISKHNHPDITQVGDVRSVTSSGFDLVIGGSPCQNLSTSGNKSGLSGDKSSLFYEFKRVLDLNKNSYFLLENVRGTKQATEEITSLIGVEPVLLNSSLVSAQNRNRLYWTNIPFNKDILDIGVLLKDIVDSPILSNVEVSWDKAVGVVGVNGCTYDENKFFRTMKAPSSRQRIISASRGGECKSKTLTAGSSNLPGDGGTAVYTDELTWRDLTIDEKERLQTLPKSYTDIGVSNSKRAFHIGNSWTVDIVAEIFKGLNK